MEVCDQKIRLTCKSRKPLPFNPRKTPGRRILLFFSVLAISIYCFDLSIKVALRRVSTGEVGALNRALTGRANAQIVINGSSRAVVHYDPHILQKTTKKTVFNNGRNASHTDLQYALLKEYLKVNLKPDLVIQNLDIHTFETTEEIYEPAQYIPYLKNEQLYQNLYSIDAAVWKWRVLPLYGIAVQDTKMIWLNSLPKLLFRGDQLNSGYFPSERSWTGEFDRFLSENPNGFVKRIDSDCVIALENIIKLCKLSGIKVLLIYSPEYREAQSLTKNRQEVFTKFNEIARTYEVSFWDYSHSQISTNRNFFYNSQHLNRNGAEEFSADIARRLSELGDIYKHNVGINRY